jgi:hypothetical protein
LVKRRELRIPGTRTSGRIVATPELVAVLNLPTKVVRRSTGLPRDRIAKLRKEHGIETKPPSWRWTPEFLRRLGKEPDSRIARDLGIHSHSVQDKRRRLGIPAFRRQSTWTPKEIALLETVSDETVAVRTGRTLRSVTTKRMRLRKARSVAAPGRRK